MSEAWTSRLEQSLVLATQPMQLVSLLGAVCILSAYALQVAGRLELKNPLHPLLNMVGAGLLLVTAVAQLQIGFILLEGVWTCVSAWGLAKSLKAKSPQSI